MGSRRGEERSTIRRKGAAKKRGDSRQVHQLASGGRKIARSHGFKNASSRDRCTHQLSAVFYRNHPPDRRSQVHRSEVSGGMDVVFAATWPLVIAQIRWFHPIEAHRPVNALAMTALK